jgi:hypothetical protein
MLASVSAAFTHMVVTTRLYCQLRCPNAVALAGTRSNASSPSCSTTITVLGDGVFAYEVEDRADGSIAEGFEKA